MFSYIFMSMQMRSFLYSVLGQRAISQILFGTRVGVIVICNHDYLLSITFFSNHKVICNRGFL